MSRSPALRLRHVTKSFDGISAVTGLDLEVSSGEILSLVGPSGCGKTTTLRLVAGLEKADSGTVEIGGRECSAVPPEERGVGFVFQDYALFPHLDVARNVAFGLRHLPREARQGRVLEILELVGLSPLAHRLPHELSGGQAQRAALARAVAPRPSLLLLDEPFSNLDAQLRRRVRHDVLAIIRDSGAAAVWVTHDQDEGLIVSDRIAVMDSGRLRQTGTPAEIWRTPADAWIAAFMGRGDLLTGRVRQGLVRTALGDVQAGGQPEGVLAEILLRPEDVVLAEGGWPGKVVRRHFRGSDNVYCVQLQDGELIHSLQSPEVELPIGSSIGVRIASSHLPVFPVTAPSSGR
ncbi:MAG: ABC transporter ATP-binding protein [Candidatus Methylomirabilales bacterium]